MLTIGEEKGTITGSALDTALCYSPPLLRDRDTGKPRNVSGKMNPRSKFRPCHFRSSWVVLSLIKALYHHLF